MDNFDQLVKIGNEAVECLNNNDVYSFFQCIGVLKYLGAEDYALILTSCYYFRIKDYSRCLDELNSISKFSETIKDPSFKSGIMIWYWDYKISSLAYLGRFEEIRRIFFEGAGPFENDDIEMSINGYALAKYLSFKSGFEEDGVGIFRPDGLVKPDNEKDDLFKLFFLLEFGNDLLDIFIKNEERIVLKDSGIGKQKTKELRDQLLRKLSSIKSFTENKYLHIDSRIIDQLNITQNRIGQDKRIDIIGFGVIIIPIILSTSQQYEDVAAWIYIIKLVSLMLSNDEFLRVFNDYLPYVEEKLRKKNEVVADLIMTLCKKPQIAEKLYNDVPFKEYWFGKLDKYMPSYLENHKIYAVDNRIFDNLSKNSKWTYEAAIWQYEQFIEHGDEMQDAGLLSLSFMRLLETEMNSRFIEPVRKKLNRNKSTIEVKGNIKDAIDGKHPTLADMRYFFKDARENDSDEKKLVHSILVNDVLSDSGIRAFEQGEFESILEQSILDKYRNPPAHSRYLHKQEAIDAKEYVEKKLKEIFSYSKG